MHAPQIGTDSILLATLLIGRERAAMLPDDTFLSLLERQFSNCLYEYGLFGEDSLAQGVHFLFCETSCLLL